MTVVAIDNGKTFLARDVVDGQVQLTAVETWIIVDDDQEEALCALLPRNGMGGVVAARIAELLERHGLTDIPDTIGETT